MTRPPGAAGDEDSDVFRRLVLAPIIEPTSKLDAIRVLDEAGIPAPSYPTIKRCLEPQITVGLLTDQDGSQLMIQAFEGNRAETATMLPVIRSFMHAYDALAQPGRDLRGLGGTMVLLLGGVGAPRCSIAAQLFGITPSL